MPYNPATKRWVAGGLNVADLNASNDDTLAIATKPMPPGAVLARTLAARFADALNVLDYVLPVDADHTNAFNRAVARALALNSPVCLDVPAGTYTLSAAVSAVLTGNTAITLRGAGSGSTIIRQTADADGFAATLQNYGPAYGLRGCFNVSGLAIVMAAAASSTRTALKLATTGVSGNTGVPVTIDDVVIASPNPGAAYWGVGISLMAFANVGYLSRITIYSAGARGTGIAIDGNSQSYTTAIFGRDTTLFGLATGLVLGDYLQGIQWDTLFTVNTTEALRSFPTLPAGDNAYIFTNCYLYGKTLFRALEGATASFQMRFANCYFDGNVNGPGAVIDRHVSFINVPQVTITGCTFNGAIPPASQPIVGLYIENQSYDTLVAHNTFGGYGAPNDGGSSCALSLASNTANVTVSDNVFDYNSKAVANQGAGNVFANNRVLRCESGAEGYYAYGLPGAQPAVAPVILGPGIALTTANSGIDIGSTAAANTPFHDFHSSGYPRDYDGRIIGSGGSATADGKGTLDYIALLHRFTGLVTADDLNVAGTGSLAAAWAATTPAVISATGTLGTATGAVRARKLGRTVFFTAEAFISANGSGAGTVNITLPYATAANAAFGGRDFYNGKAVVGIMVANSTTLNFSLYDGSYPAVSGSRLVVSGAYEANS